MLIIFVSGQSTGDSNTSYETLPPAGTSSLDKVGVIDGEGVGVGED